MKNKNLENDKKRKRGESTNGGKIVQNQSIFEGVAKDGDGSMQMNGLFVLRLWKARDDWHFNNIKQEPYRMLRWLLIDVEVHKADGEQPLKTSSHVWGPPPKGMVNYDIDAAISVGAGFLFRLHLTSRLVCLWVGKVEHEVLALVLNVVEPVEEVHVDTIGRMEAAWSSNSLFGDGGPALALISKVMDWRVEKGSWRFWQEFWTLEALNGHGFESGERFVELIVHSISRAVDVDARLARLDERSRHVQINDECLCDSCHARLGTKLFAMYPDDTICFRRQGESTSVKGRDFKRDIMFKPGWLVNH
ncbi:hypothetical protein RJ639_013789 [Escallonia herrerae]|uniref:Vacuolar sorting protein 39/Transforming growth factor beta receptor-associated zinc finger domain-containing protein n=1 Tax=Escallonia herrerae TaxID=1293975 RepID=A0AA88VI35_9ASTE|nr:hypothetical protein RJ639_013789 [Escallonia herrerae]